MAINENKTYTATIVVQSVGSSPYYQIKSSYSEELNEHLGSSDENTPEAFKIISDAILHIMGGSIMTIDEDGDTTVEEEYLDDDMVSEDDPIVEDNDGVILRFPNGGKIS